MLMRRNAFRSQGRTLRKRKISIALPRGNELNV